MSICKVTDFKEFPLAIPVNQQNSTQLSQAITWYETIFLSELFNEDDLTAYNALVGANKTTLDGLLKEAFKCFIYFHFVQDYKTQLTQSGPVETTPDNAKNMSNPDFLIKIYNVGVDKRNEAVTFMNDNDINNNQNNVQKINAFSI